MNNRYRLFYRDIELGEVGEEDSDFPNLFGSFHPIAFDNQTLLSDHLQRYIAYSIAADGLMQEGNEDEWDKFAAENEAQFLDLIETDDWHLSDEGRIVGILIPNFCQNSKIVWRWNIGTVPLGTMS